MELGEMIQALKLGRQPCADPDCREPVVVLEGPVADAIVEELHRLQGLEK